MIKCQDSSNAGAVTTRILCVDETNCDDHLLAFYPERASLETVWLAPDDVAELAVQIAAWAAMRGGRPYGVAKRKLTGKIVTNK